MGHSCGRAGPGKGSGYHMAWVGVVVALTLTLALSAVFLAGIDTFPFPHSHG